MKTKQRNKETTLLPPWPNAAINHSHIKLGFHAVLLVAEKKEAEERKCNEPRMIITSIEEVSLVA
jgi:hypothetical protein